MGSRDRSGWAIITDDYSYAIIASHERRDPKVNVPNEIVNTEDLRDVTRAACASANTNANITRTIHIEALN